MKKCREGRNHVLTTYYVLGTVKSTLYNIFDFPPKQSLRQGFGSRYPMWKMVPGSQEWCIMGTSAQFHWGPSKELYRVDFRIIPLKSRRLCPLTPISYWLREKNFVIGVGIIYSQLVVSTQIWLKKVHKGHIFGDFLFFRGNLWIVFPFIAYYLLFKKFRQTDKVGLVEVSL